MHELWRSLTFHNTESRSRFKCLDGYFKETIQLNPKPIAFLLVIYTCLNYFEEIKILWCFNFDLYHHPLTVIEYSAMQKAVFDWSWLHINSLLHINSQLHSKGDKTTFKRWLLTQESRHNFPLRAKSFPADGLIASYERWRNTTMTYTTSDVIVNYKAHRGKSIWMKLSTPRFFEWVPGIKVIIFSSHIDIKMFPGSKL